jgi:peptidoglycan/xylan/chitin deacetylase (PgdA/CDA1 family)
MKKFNYKKPHKIKEKIEISKSLEFDDGLKSNRKIYHIALILIILASLVATGVFVFIKNFKKSQNNQSGSLPGQNLSPLPTKTPRDINLWWDFDSSYYGTISVKNNNGEITINPNEVVTLTFNHENLVKQGKSKANGEDLKLVYLREDNKFAEVNFSLQNPNTDKTILQLATYQALKPKSTDDFYYLYYGGSSKRVGISLSANQKPAVNQDYEVSIGEEKSHPINVQLSRQWVLVGGSVVDEKYKSSDIKVTTTYQDVTDMTMTVLDFRSFAVLTIPLTKGADGSFSTKITSTQLNPDEYSLQITANRSTGKVNSPKKKLYISHPLYLNWSIDWEGFGVEDRWLQGIERISNEFNIPITHYFNPRIYIGGMTAARADYLTKWVLERQKKGDEIQLHLHMWFDMVKTLGIVEKKTPNWNNENSGHDVPETAYTAEEFDKMIVWAKEQFAAHGLPVPYGYRAGGWQTNVEHLKVLVKYGFKYDSSGRDYVKFGNNQVAVPWHLDANTQPYIPSGIDMNVASSTNPIGLVEFPNNGDNSSNYGQNSTKVIDIFKLNYTAGQVLKSKQVLVVLSHAQYFNIDEVVMRKYFTEVGKSAASLDKGPVIYTTVAKLLPEYQK